MFIPETATCRQKFRVEESNDRHTDLGDLVDMNQSQESRRINTVHKQLDKDCDKSSIVYITVKVCDKRYKIN